MFGLEDLGLYLLREWVIPRKGKGLRSLVDRTQETNFFYDQAVNSTNTATYNKVVSRNSSAM
jgi:hypothetical protein